VATPSISYAPTAVIAAKRGVTQQTVRRWVRAGILPGVKIGDRVLVLERPGTERKP